MNYIAFFVLILLVSCESKKNIDTSPKIEEAIIDLTKRFTQFPKGKAKQSDHYKLVKSVINGESHFEIQLRSEADSLNDPQKMLILINSKQQSCAIPFFSNTYKDYWGFSFENKPQKTKPVNTTFTKELINAINYLKLNDTIGTGNAVIGEILFSLLNCDRVTKKDSSNLMMPTLNINNDLDIENDKETQIRLQKNCAEMSKHFYKTETFIDTQNSRVYQIFNDTENNRKIIKPIIKCYRQDQITHLYNE